MATLQNAVVVVTGAGRGIGRAIAEELGSGGAKIVANYARSKGAAEDLVTQLMQNGCPKAIALRADVSLHTQATHLIEQTIQEFGRIDVLVNNAGINIDKTIKNMAVEDWDAVVTTNLNGYFYTIKAAQPYMIKQGSGAIINISSFVGQGGNFGQANYAAAKAGIIGLTKVAALEMARYNITVNAICPGFIETDMFGGVPDKVKEGIIQRIPLGRIGTPRDVALGVRYLIEGGDYITGQELSINGGVYM